MDLIVVRQLGLALAVVVLLHTARRFAVSGTPGPPLIRIPLLIGAGGVVLAVVGAALFGEWQWHDAEKAFGGMLAGVALVLGVIPTFWRSQVAAETKSPLSAEHQNP